MERAYFNGSDFTEEGVLKQKLNGYVADWEKVYELEEYAQTLDLGSRFVKVLEAAHRQTGRRAVVLVDEYDKPILDVLDHDKKLTRSWRRRTETR